MNGNIEERELTPLGNHNDTIDAGGGNDVIWGGNGADSLTGGAGDDLFAFLRAGESAPGRPDTISDWGDGADCIFLALIDASTVDGVDNAFSWGGENTSVVVNSVTWYYDGATDTTIVQGDTDGMARQLRSNRAVITSSG
jgi:Ca2+-binding RTX toxin-like protein